MGLHRAGFDVTGVDLIPQPHYPFRFIQADALQTPLDSFDLIWASPPCQAHTTLRGLGKAKTSDIDLIPTIRQRLQKAGCSFWVIENVVGAPLENPARLCGSSFGLAVRRHRLFEANFSIPRLLCSCRSRRNTGVYGKRPGDRLPDGVHRAANLAEGRAAMGIDWMNWRELTQAIPPAYAEHIGKQICN